MRSAGHHYPLEYRLMNNPLDTFHTWLEDAKRHGVHEPNAMALGTVDTEGRPSVRMVLLKHADEKGFVFYTNIESPKAADLRHLPYASLCFYWNPPGRQVRVSGRVEPVTDVEADAYFNSRPYLSRIGAWASKQSQPLDGYAELERAVATTMVKHPRGRMPRPPHWHGYRVVPDSIELWQERPFRLHERMEYTLSDKGWKEQALYP
jgi:pyridoxamine 5'-phosphate oxidase